MTADDRVLELLDEGVESKPDDTFTVLSNGVVLEHIKIPPLIFTQLKSKYKEPPVPVDYDENKGRKIPNPNHPDYLQAIEDNNMAFGNAMLDIFIGRGTRLKHKPDNVQAVEDAEWADDLVFLGVVDTVPKSGLGRYLYWVKFYCAEDAKAVAAIADKTKRLLGITEEEVAESITNFPSDETRTANPQS